MYNKSIQVVAILLIFLTGMLAFSCNKEEDPQPVTDAPVPSFGYTFSLTTFNQTAGYEVVLTNTTTDTAGVTFAWSVPGSTQLTANTFFVPETPQLTVSLSASRTTGTGLVLTRTTSQTLVFTLPPPPPPSFTLADGGFRLSPGAPVAYFIEFQNLTQDTTLVEFVCSMPLPAPDPQTGKIYIPVSDSGPYTITLTAKRGGQEQTATRQVYVKGYTPPAPAPGFDITRGTFYQVPMKRPDGSDWNAGGTPPNQILMITDYHVNLGFINAGNLPEPHTFTRTKWSAPSPGSGTKLIDPHPDQYHEIVYQYTLPGEAPVTYPTGIGFIPNDHRFAGTDSGYVELQNGLTHLKLWMKFTD